MKWGVRKAKQPKFDDATAKQEYKKLYKAKSKYEHAVRMTRHARRQSYRSTDVALRSPFKSARRLAEIHRQEYRNERKNLKEAKQAYKDQKKHVRKNATVKQKMSHGAKRIPGIMAKVGAVYAADQIFYGGAGTRAVKNGLKAVGILTVSAVAKARGATDIHWYDKDGRKIV
jgi:hypothetical protein